MDPVPTPLRPDQPDYLRVLRTFLVNSLVREMQFRGNFVIELLTHAFWFTMQVVLFRVIFGNVSTVNGWSRGEYFGFMATAMILNALMEAFFVPNLANLSEMVRTGGLDFALLKPIDTQFLVSFEKLDLGAFVQLLLPSGLLAYSFAQTGHLPSLGEAALYLALLLLSVAIYYSLMLIFASTSVWLGRNQGLYEFWFYITIFARYPRDIYRGSWAADVLRFGFSFVLPILLVVTVPAEVIVGRVFQPGFLAVLVLAAGVCLVVSRWVFHRALRAYGSASS
jgi:ABC-2 type transport system permease protein